MKTESDLSNWQSQIAAYRVGIIVVAVLFMGVGITFLVQHNTGGPSVSTTTVPTPVSDSVPGRPHTLSLSQNDDPEILMAQTIDSDDIDADLDREIDQLDLEFHE